MHKYLLFVVMIAMSLIGAKANAQPTGNSQPGLLIIYDGVETEVTASAGHRLICGLRQAILLAPRIRDQATVSVAALLSSA
jgi:hypothetical protein